MRNRADTPMDRNAHPKTRPAVGAAPTTHTPSLAHPAARNGGMIDDTRIEDSDDIEEPIRDVGAGSGNIESADRSRSGDRGIE